MSSGFPSDEASRAKTRKSKDSAVLDGCGQTGDPRGLAVLVLLAAVALIAVLLTPRVLDEVSQVLANGPAALYRTLTDEFVLNPWFYAVLSLVLSLEIFLPAKFGQSLASLGAGFDASFWFVLFAFQKAIVLPAVAVILRLTFDSHLSFLRIEAVESWPWVARVTLAVLFGDFVFWFSHVVRHKIQAMWAFHAVHHSQRQLNFFSEFRVHPGDSLLVYVINFIPILAVERGFATVLAIVLLREWHTFFYHSNVRTNFGILRYVLVTPQSHRIHHSSEPRHRDKNFGLTFSIWDHLFGTQYRGYDEYPDTGIEEDFPVEQNQGPLRAVPAQLIYPFRALFRRRS